MKKKRAFPLILLPEAGESLPSYIERLAARHQVPLIVMLFYLGIIENEKCERINGYGIFLSPSKLQSVADVTQQTTDTISGMLLSAYDGIAIDFKGVDHTSVDGLRLCAASQWAYFSGSHVCPQCINETKSWKLCWKLPWSFVCLKHKCYLVPNCSACGRRHKSGRVDRSLSPISTGHVPELGICSNPNAFRVASTGKANTQCRFPVHLNVTEVASARAIAAQEIIDAKFSDDLANSHGHNGALFAFLQELRSLSALVLYFAEVEDIGQWPATETAVFSRYAQERNRIVVDRGRSSSPRNAGRTRTYIGTPTDPVLVAIVASLSLDILRSETPDDMAHRMRKFGKRCTDRMPKRKWIFSDSFHLSSRLDAAFRGCLAEGANFDRSSGNKSLITEGEEYDFEARHVPQIITKSDYDRLFARLMPEIRENYARRYCSMSLLKMRTGCTWTEAAAILNLPVCSAQYAGRVRGGLNNTSNSKYFAEHLHSVAKSLSDNKNKVDFQERRKLLKDFVDFPEKDWKATCDEAGINYGWQGSRSRYAAAWLWAELTGGDWKLAPGMRQGNTESLREGYRNQEKEIFPKIAEALRAYGRERLLPSGENAKPEILVP